MEKIFTIQELQQAVHQNSIDHGFYDRPFNPAEKLALIHSEVSEALEAERNEAYAHRETLDALYHDVIIDADHNLADVGTKNELIEYFERKIKNTYGDELADAVIRIMDLAQYEQIDLYKHIMLKHWYNKQREYKHGKKY